MQYFTEQAQNHWEALEKVKLKYGSNAQILTHRSIRTGGFLGFLSREGVEVTGFISPETVKRKSLDMEEEKKKILAQVAATKSDQTMQLLLSEIQDLKLKMEDQKQQKMDTVSQVREEHPTLAKIQELLEFNEFSPWLIRETIQRIKRSFSVADLSDFNLIQDAVLEWIGQKIAIYSEKPKVIPRIFILVGPTGVGKTTTIAKLAAFWGLGANNERPLKVRIITIDNYRIAAKQQIQTYGEIMGIPVASAESVQELKKQVAIHQDADLILIDTIGKSPRDMKKLGEMKEILDSLGLYSEIHLALSAVTKTSDAADVLQQFEPFKYRSVIVTKLDETTRTGNIISVLAEKNKSISYITDGQTVPQDIQKARAVGLLKNLEGFTLKREKLEKLFSEVSEG